MQLRVHNDDIDIPLSSACPIISQSKQNKMLYKKYKCYLYTTGWVCEFPYKLVLAINLQLCMGIPHPISHELYTYTDRKCIIHIGDRELDIVQRKVINNELFHQYNLTILNFTRK